MAGFCIAWLPGLAACGAKIDVNASGTTTGAGAATSSSSTGAGGALGSSSSSAGGGFGVSSSSSSGGIDAGACPAVSPNDGDPCTTPGLVCNGGYCCGISATCDGQTWHVSGTVDCGEPCLACPGGASCGPDAVCVVYTTSPDSPAHCAVNPCNGAPLSCACADSVCLNHACDHTSGDTVSCTGALGGP